MSKNILNKEIKLKCECAGGERSCGSLLIIMNKIKGKPANIEINFVPYKRKRSKEGVWLEAVSLKKLIKFLK